MKNAFIRKISALSGVSRLVVVLIVAAVVLLVAAIIPFSIHRREISEKIGCTQALDTGTRQLYNHYLAGDIHSVKDAKALVTYVMNGWDDLCPGGGTMHIVYDETAEKPYRLACGIHDPDTVERTNLNARYVLDQLRDKLEVLRAKGEKYPESIEVSLNSKTYTALLTDKESGFVRGTYNTPGASGTVIFYAVAGSCEFASSFGAPDGEISYFSFADENHVANWNAKTAWSGDRKGD